MGNILAGDFEELGELLRRWVGQEGADAWRQQARCGDPHEPGDRFMPDSPAPEIGDRSLRRARLLCATCPVRLHCSLEALERGWQGVWAGTTAAERESVQHLPLVERVRVLDERFRQLATMGPWRVVAPNEWEALVDQEGGVHLRPEGVLGSGGDPPTLPAGSAGRGPGGDRPDRDREGALSLARA